MTQVVVGSNKWREAAIRVCPELVVEFDRERNRSDIVRDETPEQTWARIMKNAMDESCLSDGGGLGVLGPGIPGGR